jgi:hypothetical protein
MNTAVDLGSAGLDNTYGAGRINADAAAAAAGCTAVTPTPTPSPTATPTSTPTRTPTRTPTPTITPAPDTDGDGCTDAQEIGDDEVHGGDRDPAYAGDFFDVTGDRSIDLADVIAILQRFGLGPGPPPSPGYDVTYDRYIPDSTKLWRTAFAVALPHLGIDIADAVNNLQSFGHSCAPGPA